MKENETIGIIGLGKFGMPLAIELAKANKEIVCLDKNERKVKEMLEYTEFAYVTDDLSKQTLEELGFASCETVVICIGEKIDISVLTCVNLISLGVKKVIAKAVSEEQGSVLEQLGAEVVFPDKDSALRLSKKILSDSILEFISLSKDVEIVEVKLPKRYKGKMIKECDIRTEYNLNIVALKQGEIIETYINPEYIFNEKDKIVVIGNKKDINRFQKNKVIS